MLAIILLSAIGLFGLIVIGLPLLVLFSHILREKMAADALRAADED